MRERRRHEPRRVLPLDAVAALPDNARLPLQIGERGLPGRLVRLRDLEPGRVVAEGVQQADALRHREHQVKPRHRPQLPLDHAPLTRRRVQPLHVDRSHRYRWPQPRAGRRILASHQLSERALRDDADQAQLDRAGADPDARTLTAPGVVIVHSLRD